jgi:hypothetical protein
MKNSYRVNGDDPRAEQRFRGQLAFHVLRSRTTWLQSLLMSITAEPEQAIRTYLTSLKDPASLVNVEHIAELERRAEASTDPIEKLKALAALSKARVPDLGTFEQAFVKHARTWAETNDIPPATFGELGVPEKVLRVAGLLGRQGRPSRASRRRDGVAAGRSVTATTIAESILAQGGHVFTLADVAHMIGGSPMTIRKAVDGLVQSGKVIRLGPTPNWSGRGRAPLQFKKS